jgi:uncharacterized protein YbbC (DUF1343 family)
VGAVIAQPVKPGIDVLEQKQLDLLKDKRVAVITNQTGINSAGTHLVDLLRSKDVKLVKLFSPEHGLYGVKDEKVADSVDERTGLPVFSLYGKSRRPTRQMLDGVDVLIFDIQDIGTRFYTYISTMGLCMEACADYGVEFFVLDRPNPISGTRIDGPLADSKHLGFTAYREIPLVHGMTVGELARLFNAEYKINAKLTVVQMEGWKRSMYWEDTGAKWVNPSPNMRSPLEAVLYPAVGLLESSNVSVGRGTDTPFELVGAPYIDAQKFADALNELKLPGIEFSPETFTPVNTPHKFNKKQCQGVRIKLTDRGKFQAAMTGCSMAWVLNKLYPGDWSNKELVKMLQNDDAAEKVLKLDDPKTAATLWINELREWIKVREKYLIYRD